MADAPRSPRVASDRRNNFDLIRLGAALQVCFIHAVGHLQWRPAALEPVHWVLTQFPRVPVFFFLSGYLLTYSFENAPSLADYARKRARRIFPGLLACFGITLVVLWFLGFLPREVVLSPVFAAWVVAQTTAGQFFNPSFLSGFGVGVVNGSLWTIPVELGFYVALPVITIVLRPMSRRAANVLLLCVGVVSLATYAALLPLRESSLLLKLLFATPIPHLFMFLLGIGLRRNFEAVRAAVEGRAAHWCAGYLAVSGLLAALQLPQWALLAIQRPLLVMTVLALAYSGRSLAGTLLRGHDLSYGIFLYHMLPVNVLLHLGYGGSGIAVLVSFAVTLGAAAFSWWCVERRFSSRARAASAIATTSAAVAPSSAAR